MDVRRVEQALDRGGLESLPGVSHQLVRDQLRLLQPAVRIGRLAVQRDAPGSLAGHADRGGADRSDNAGSDAPVLRRQRLLRDRLPQFQVRCPGSARVRDLRVRQERRPRVELSERRADVRVYLQHVGALLEFDGRVLGALRAGHVDVEAVHGQPGTALGRFRGVDSGGDRRAGTLRRRPELQRRHVPDVEEPESAFRRGLRSLRQRENRGQVQREQVSDTAHRQSDQRLQPDPQPVRHGDVERPEQGQHRADQRAESGAAPGRFRKRDVRLFGDCESRRGAVQHDRPRSQPQPWLQLAVQRRRPARAAAARLGQRELLPHRVQGPGDHLQLGAKSIRITRRCRSRVLSMAA